jgi:hypothetical protein
MMCPVAAELGRADLRDRQRVGDVGGDRDEIGRRRDRTQVDEQLERSQGKARRRVDEGRSWPVPAPAMPTSAFTVERRVLALADAPDARQL